MTFHALARLSFYFVAELTRKSLRVAYQSGWAKSDEFGYTQLAAPRLGWRARLFRQGLLEPSDVCVHDVQITRVSRTIAAGVEDHRLNA